MENPFCQSDTNKRYHTLTYHHKRLFGRKVVKIPLNGGFTCPNIDGTKGRGGCTYCSSSGSGEFGGTPADSLEQQFWQGVRRVSKWPDAGRIPYFQAHTNTYAPVERLRALFEPALLFPDVVGLSIATRADCLAPQVLDYLEELAGRTYLTVELGLQSAYDVTGERINRCHDYAVFQQGCRELAKRGIRVCVHLINGLPGENREMMVDTVRQISALPIGGVKLHMLYVLQGTAIAQEFLRGELPLLSQEEFVQVVCDQLEWLPPEVVVERLTGDGDPKTLLAPLWTRKKTVTLNEIDKELVRRGTCQGWRVVLA